MFWIAPRTPNGPERVCPKDFTCSYSYAYGVPGRKDAGLPCTIQIPAEDRVSRNGPVKLVVEKTDITCGACDGEFREPGAIEVY
jgi:hypothetical protein